VVYAGLAPGRYAVGVKSWWFGTIVGSASVTLTEGLVEQRFVLPSLAQDDFVLLRVLGPDGKDLANPQIGMRFNGESRSGILETAPAVRQADGRWRVPVRPGDIAEDSGARVELDVRARGLGQRRVDVSGKAGSSMVVRLDEAAVLSVEVPGAARDPRTSGLRVDLREKTHDGSSTMPAHSIDADGRHVFAPRQPGPVEVRLVLVRNGREWRVAGRRLDLASGPQLVTLSVPAFHRVVLTGAPPGTALVLHQDVDGEREDLWLDADADGRVTIDGLPDGEYYTRAEEGVPASTFRVSGPGEFALK
jgi:hypothetical protein